MSGSEGRGSRLVVLFQSMGKSGTLIIVEGIITPRDVPTLTAMVRWATAKTYSAALFNENFLLITAISTSDRPAQGYAPAKPHPSPESHGDSDPLGFLDESPHF